MECWELLISDRTLLIFGIVFSIAAIPYFALYSRYIYKKHGVFVTKFNHPDYNTFHNYKDFASKNLANRLFGTLIIVLWAIAVVFIAVKVVLITICWLI